jgi:hypothetical protein
VPEAQVHALATAAGITVTGPVVRLDSGTNSVWAVPCALPRVLRVAGDDVPVRDLVRHVTVARILNEHGVPFAQPADGPQPVVARRRRATVWRALEVGGGWTSLRSAGWCGSCTARA